MSIRKAPMEEIVTVIDAIYPGLSLKVNKGERYRVTNDNLCRYNSNAGSAWFEPRVGMYNLTTTGVVTRRLKGKIDKMTGYVAETKGQFTSWKVSFAEVIAVLEMLDDQG